METKKVLVVEDDPASRFMMGELLAELGVEVVVAEDAFEGLNILNSRSNEIDLVLMDIHMPGMSGDEAVARLRAAGSGPLANIPVVSVSADHYWADPIVSKEAGFTAFVIKPVRLKSVKDLFDFLEENKVF